MSPNSNNPVLVSRIDDHSPRRKKKLPVQSAVLLSSAPRRLTGQNAGGVSLGYEGVHVYRGWGYHGAHAGLLRHSPQRAPSLKKSDGPLILGKGLKHILAGPSAHRLTRRRSLAHTGSLFQKLRRGSSGTQFKSQWNGETTWAAGSKRPRVLCPERVKRDQQHLGVPAH